MGIREDFEGREIFLFADNTLSKSIVSNGSSTSEVLYDLIMGVFKLEMQYQCCEHFLHVSGNRIIQQGADGLSRVYMFEVVIKV